jgi:signal transduction histidine kinase
MTNRQQLIITIGGAAALTLVALIAIVHGPFPAQPVDIVPRMYVGALCLGAGVLIGRWRRGNNTSWLLVVAGGLLLMRLLSWSNHPSLFTLGGVISGVDYAIFAHLALALPDGRLSTALDRTLAIGGYVLALASGVLPNLYFECQSEFGFGCPGNLLLVRDDPDAVNRVEDVFAIVGTAFVMVVVARLAWRWHTATPVLRRAVGLPFAVVAAALTVAVLDLVEAWDRWGDVAALVHPLVVSLIPIAVLVGVLRSKARAGDIGDLVVSVEEAGPSIRTELQHLLAQTLADPSVRLVAPDHVASLAPGPDRLRTAITANGQTLAVMESDRAVDAEPEVLAAALATASLALENEQLIEKVTRQLDAAKESRARLLAAQLAERQRIERDLHDGAQQRLVTTLLLLGMARDGDGTDPSVIASAIDELSAALDELRNLARGVHPATVTEHGLPVALEALAERAPLPVAVRADVPRLSPLSEITAYFVVAEALTNVAKHARATHADVELSVMGDHLVVSVTDDGCGGADTSRGSGLVGLHDRVDAAGGHLEFRSDPGHGTTLRIELPHGEADRATTTSTGAP